jgi:hypothetical protein
MIDCPSGWTPIFFQARDRFAAQGLTINTSTVDLTTVPE